MKWFIFALLFFGAFCKDDIIRLEDPKALKKLLKSRTNVLVLYTNVEDPKLIAEYSIASTKLKGRGTLALANCRDTKATKKLCKDDGELDSKQSFVIKHYKEGQFSEDYKRALNAKSFERFMLNPSAEAPWEEDETSKDVVHLTDSTIEQTIAKKTPTLIMFYAPWCGHCKRMKPDYAAAATQLKGKAILAAIDTTEHRTSGVRFNISGFPTIKYFEDGEYKYEYGHSRTLNGILDFIANPGPPPPPPAPEPDWSDIPSKVNHLTDQNFDSFMATHNSTLVMFYAPWCGHCKAAKPEYQEAAEALLAENINGALAAVDATKFPSLGQQYDVTGYPTFWYFKNGEKAFGYTQGRKKDDFVNFLKNPQEPPPPPPAEPGWSESKNEVFHLTDENFHKSLKNKKHAIVMFYAPWCGHCKAFKPAYEEAADALKDNKKVRIAAVDCTLHNKVASEFGINGFPTIKYFSNGKFVEDYAGARTKEGVIDFLSQKGMKTEL